MFTPPPPDCPRDPHRSAASVEFAATLCRLLESSAQNFSKEPQRPPGDNSTLPPTRVDPWATCQGNFPNASVEPHSPDAEPLAAALIPQPNRTPAMPASAV